MSEATESSSTIKNSVGFLEMPVAVVGQILDNVYLETVRNVRQLTRSTILFADLYKPTSQPVKMTKLVCTVRETDVALRKLMLTQNEKGRSECKSDKKLYIPKPDSIEFLHKCAPEQICLNGRDEFLKLDPNWLEKVGKITLNLYDNSLKRYLPMLKHCSQLDIWYAGPCNAIEIISSMASVERFKYMGRQIEITDKTMLALGAAIRRGKGLIHLEIYTYDVDHWISLETYINFVEALHIHSSMLPITIRVGKFSVNARKHLIDNALCAKYKTAIKKRYGLMFNPTDVLWSKVIELHFEAVPEPSEDHVH